MTELTFKIESYLNYINENINDIKLNTILLLTIELQRLIMKNVDHNDIDFNNEINIILSNLVADLKQFNNDEILNIHDHKKIQLLIMKIEETLYVYNPVRIEEEDLEKDFEDYKVIIDPYENFKWGGLSGEEAHDAYWNTD